MKKFVKILASVIVFLIIGLFIFRCCMVADRSFGKTPYPTDALKTAFADGDAVVYTHDQTAEIASDGYFSAFNLFYCPEAEEAQFSVRWNDSAYEYTDTEVGHEFTFVLVNETTGDEYPCSVIESDSRALYNYRRLAVQDAVISSGDQISAHMIVNDGYSSKQVIKYDGQAFKEYKLPAKLLNELAD